STTILVVDARFHEILIYREARLNGVDYDKPVPFTYDPTLYPNGQMPQGALITHGDKRSNYLFHDGHARSLRPIDTLSPLDLWDYQAISRRHYSQAELDDLVRHFAPEYR